MGQLFVTLFVARSALSSNQSCDPDSLNRKNKHPPHWYPSWQRLPAAQSPVGATPLVSRVHCPPLSMARAPLAKRGETLTVPPSLVVIVNVA
jgi:hypothetical protein